MTLPLRAPASVATRLGTVSPRLGLTLVLAAAYVFTGDWLLPAALLVLWANWMLLPGRGGPPVLALACTHQWAQVTAGYLFKLATGREAEAYLARDWREMLLLGLGTVLALAVGLRLGTGGVTGTLERGVDREQPVSRLALVYFVVSVLVGGLKQLTIAIPALQGLSQGAIFLGYARLVVFFVVLRQLLRPRFRWVPFTAFVVFETLVGLTGYLANFREIFVLAALALVEAFDRRRLAHWVTALSLGITLGVTGLIWQGVKGQVRAYYTTLRTLPPARERLAIVERFAGQYLARPGESVLSSLDEVVSRSWAIYYPALALARVPGQVPHTDGAFLARAVQHVLTPRFFFPDKAPLFSDSEKVRRYAGVWVAGEETGTSIAFGYAIESYIDFGMPMLFVPIFLFGMLAGRVFRFFVTAITTDLLVVGFTTVAFWLSLFLFEVSWDRLLGVSTTIMIFLGGGVLLADRFFIQLRALGRAAPRA